MSETARKNGILPFRVELTESAIQDLQRRIHATRWPERETVTDWAQGVPLQQAQKLLQRWGSSYDHRRIESILNEYPQFTTKIDGLEIHFLHVQSPHAEALPLLITHGWPGSVVEFLQVIQPLVNPTAFGGKAEDAFHVVIPALPGFGFSEKPKETGWNLVRIATSWTTLMQRLGYQRWISHGGDWGAAVCTVLGHMRPSGLAGVHITWPFVLPETLPTRPSAAEMRAMEQAGRFLDEGYGYFKQQQTRPQTVGYALADSPAGQAMWIYERLQAWTQNQGSPEEAIPADSILDLISLYWFTDSAESSARLYWENKSASFSGGRLELPVAVTVYPYDIYQAPKNWIEDSYSNLMYCNAVERGGHFPALEVPELFVTEVRNAFRSLRGV